MGKHTPGPWSAVDAFGKKKDEPVEALTFCFMEIRDSEGDQVASTFSVNNERLQRANAHLIAAAPELVAEVETLIDVIEKGTETPEDLEGILKYAKGVLAKARGENG